jgi:hypothetical protein
VLLVHGAHAADQQAAALLHEALQAQGGEQNLRSIHNIQFQAFGYRNELEESERPEGPYITEFDTVSEVYDFESNRYLDSTDAVVYPVFKFSSGTLVDGNVAMLDSGGAKFAGTSQTVQIAREREALSPERLLLTALDATDTHREPDTTLQSVPQNVIVFTFDGAPVRIFLNSYTHLPTAVDYSGPEARSDYWAFLGDVTQRTYYSLWWLAKDGIHLPMQWNVESNGLPDRMLVVSKLQINEPLPNSELTIPQDIRAKFKPNAPVRNYDSIPLGLPDQPAKELAPGVVFIPGRWNVTLVQQDDGIVVLDAPISSGYSSKVIAEAHRRFPGQRIKAVITTSDSWPHIAGIREYVAQGVPVYALDLNLPILKRVIGMAYASRPDALQHSPRNADFHPVQGKTILGTGNNRLEIYPIQGETSERQMMVYFPQYHMVYGSDPFQQLPDGTFFYPQTVTELMDAVTRQHLDVQQFFMMHIGLTPWSDLDKAVKTAEAKNSPTGVL